MPLDSEFVDLVVRRIARNDTLFTENL
jgi:hypothetical protein